MAISPVDSEAVLLDSGDQHVLIEILSGATHKWREIGLILGFKSNQLDAIEHVPQQPSNYFQEVLHQWLKWSSPTVAALANALRKVGEQKCAADIKSKFQVNRRGKLKYDKTMPGTCILKDFSLKVQSGQISASITAVGISIEKCGRAIDEKEVCTTVTVKPCLSGPFCFPDEYEQVSPVYLLCIESEEPDLESTIFQVTIRHCADLHNQEDCKAMTFLVASSKPEYKRSQPEYIFKVLHQGMASFDASKQSGTVTLSQFHNTLLAVGREKAKCTASGSRKLYILQLYASPEKSHTAILCATLHHPVYTELVKEKFEALYGRCKWISGPVRLSSKEISLNIPHVHGWSIVSAISTILKEKLDHPLMYNRSAIEYPPVIYIDIESISDPPETSFAKFKVCGLEKELGFSLYLPNFSVQSMLQQGTVTVTRKMLERPSFQEVVPIPIEGQQWYTLGLTLGIEDKVLDRIQNDYQTDHKRKRAMFRKWLERPNSTWITLIEALEKLDERKIADEVKSEYDLENNSSEHDESAKDGCHTGASKHLIQIKNETDRIAPLELSTDSTGRAKPCTSVVPKPLASDTAEYLTFRKYHDAFSTAIMNDVPHIASKAFSARLISANELHELASSTLSPQSKTHKLLNFLQQRIKVDPRTFNSLISVLQDETIYGSLVEELNISRYSFKLDEVLHCSSSPEFDLSSLSQSLLNSEMITEEAFKTCLSKSRDVDKALVLQTELSKIGVSEKLVKHISAFSNTKHIVEALEMSLLKPSFGEGALVEVDGRSAKLMAQERQPEAVTRKKGSEMQVNNLFSTSEHKSSDLQKSKPRSERMKLAGKNAQYSSEMHDPELMGSSRHSSNSQLSPEHKASSGTVLSTDSEESNTTSSGSYHSLPNSSIPSTPTKRVQCLSTATEVGAPADQSQHLLVPNKETKDLEDSGIFSQAAPSTASTPSIPKLNVPLLLVQYLEAVNKKDVKTITSILQEGIINVDEVLKDGSSALMIACISGDTDVVKVLLDHKASPNAQNWHGATPLHLACSHGNYEVAKQLLAARHGFADVNAVTKDGTPVLLKPAKKGFSVITEFLLENGANPNMADKNGNTPLIAAATNNHKDVVKVLLQHGADVTAVSHHTSRTALQEAVARGHSEVATILIKATAKASEKSHLLFTCKTAESVHKLIKEGAKVDERRGGGATPLIVHADEGNKEIVEMLLNHNANVDLQDEDGLTALMKTSYRGHVQIVQILVTSRAILDLKSKRGWTAVMYGVEGNHPQVVKQLLLAGADADVRDKNGKSAHDMAKDKHQKEILELLEKPVVAVTRGDPFIKLLSVYLEKLSATRKEDSATPLHSGSTNTSIKQREPKKETVPLASTHKTGDEASTLRDELHKAWKRVADLETRIHDLTLQSTMEPPDESDLVHLDRTRLEAEYRKLKELKKKAEQYAIEAKQTAQRLSAENFKLKENLTGERHHNELTRKSMIREMEQKVDKCATASEREDAKLEVFEERVQEKALELVAKMPSPAFGRKFTKLEFKPKELVEFILKQKIRANILHIGVGGLPYSGKSTLLSNILEVLPEEHARISLKDSVSDRHGLSVYEAVMMKDTIHGVCHWINSTKDDAEVLALAVALAQVCVKSQKYPRMATFSHSTECTPEELGPVFKNSEIDAHFCETFNRLRNVMANLEKKGDLNKLTTASLTFLNCWDVGVNRVVYEILSIMAGRCKNLLLLNVLNLERDPDRLNDPPDLQDESLYKGRYSARGEDKTELKLQSSLHYFTRFIVATNREKDLRHTTLIVGTHKDKLSQKKIKESKLKVLRSVKAKAEEIGVSKALWPGMAVVDATKREDVLKVRKTVEKMIEEGNRFEREIPLKWVFLRCVLFRMKVPIMETEHLLPIAKKCGLEGEEELKEWLVLFNDCGSLIYNATGEFATLHDYVILEPVELLRSLDKLYYVDCLPNIPEDLKEHVKLAKKGYLSYPLAKHIWSLEMCSFNLSMLQNIGVIVQADGILPSECQDSCSWYFIPTLRPKHYNKKAESTSLVVTFNVDKIPFHKQSDFVLYLQRHFESHLKFNSEDYYNVVHFTWHESKEESAEIHIRFLSEIVEVSIAAKSQILQHKLCGALKTTCMEVFQKVAEDILGLKYKLTVTCPNSSDTPHFIPFHTSDNTSTLYCSLCEGHVEITDERAMWINAAYQSQQSIVLEPTDVLTAPQIAAISESLSHLSPDQAMCLGKRLGFAQREVIEKSQQSMQDLLFSLLLQWKRRNPIPTKQSLAQALLNCGYYTEAVQLDPSLLKSARPVSPEPLNRDELAVISQHIQHWKALGRALGTPPDMLVEIEKVNKSTSDRCFQVLKLWVDTSDSSLQTNRREKLCSTLNEMNYRSLADFLATGNKGLFIN